MLVCSVEKALYYRKIYGEGRVFLEIAGDSIIHDLKEGEVLYCNSGNVVAFQDSVDFDITLVKRMSTLLFGGEGNFLVKLTGPGKNYFTNTESDAESENL